MGLPTIRTLDEILARCEPCPTTGCWLWMMFTGTHSGHGRVSVINKGMYVHRYVWELVHGPILSGLQVQHHCDVPSCCNPAHLYLGTQQQNITDRDRRGRQIAPNCEAHGMAKLTAAQVQKIRASNERDTVLARQFNVAHSTISNIRQGRTWRNLSDRLNTEIERNEAKARQALGDCGYV